MQLPPLAAGVQLHEALVAVLKGKKKQGLVHCNPVGWNVMYTADAPPLPTGKILSGDLVVYEAMANIQTGS